MRESEESVRGLRAQLPVRLLVVVAVARVVLVVDAATRRHV